MSIENTFCPAAHPVGSLYGPEKYACGIIMKWGQHSPLFDHIACDNYTHCSVWRKEKHNTWTEGTGTV